MGFELLVLPVLFFAPLFDERVHEGPFFSWEKGEFVRLPVKLHHCIIAVPRVSVFLRQEFFTSSISSSTSLEKPDRSKI